MRIAVISFGPFSGRNVNGSRIVAEALVRLIGQQATHIPIETRWADLADLEGRINGFDAVLGLGEGFKHFVSIEQMAVREAVGKDVDDAEPPTDLFGEGGDTVLDSELEWERGWLEDELLQRLGLPRGSLGVALNGFDGQFLCNALHYMLLRWCRVEPRQRRASFIHLPPQEGWMARTSRTAEDYGETFAAVVAVVLEHNNWL